MYTTKSGDTWDVIAKEVYGSEYHADALMAANPEHIDTFRFSAGVVLKTPTVEDARAGTLPPWKYEAQYEYAVMWYYVAAAVVVGFAVAYAAMFGFDKLKEALGQIKKNNE